MEIFNMRRVFRLHRDFKYEDEKIYLSHHVGEIDKQFSIYLKDEKGDKHHVYWLISDCARQSFDHTNEKVKEFALSKIDEKIIEQENLLQKQKDMKQLEENKRKEFHKNLSSNF